MFLSKAQIQQFKIDGYLRLSKILSSTEVELLRAKTSSDLSNRIEPFELEASVNYPGAPESADATGGNTVRRLLNAFQRDDLFKALAENKVVTQGINEILKSKKLYLNPNHHNCIMTKQPEFSSKTLWHRDTRYWNFSDKYLINSWIALGDEKKENGAMSILPGSHRWEVEEDALDEKQFLKIDHPYNQQRLATARLVELDAGDILLFSAHCFHAAGNNTTTQSKFSVVYSYHADTTKAIEGTRSAILPAIELPKQ